MRKKNIRAWFSIGRESHEFQKSKRLLIRIRGAVFRPCDSRSILDEEVVACGGGTQHLGLLAAGLVMLFSPLVRAETIALWLCDEGGGKTLKDSSGNGHHGTIEGDVGWVEGKYGMALELGGEPDMALVPGSPDLTGANRHDRGNVAQSARQDGFFA